MSRRWCPIDVGIKVNLFLFEFNWTIISYKPTATEELSPSIGLDLESKSCILRRAGDDEKRLILVGVQTEATGQVTAMVVAHIEQKPDRLCTGDEFQEVSLWPKRASELEDNLRISKPNWHTSSSGR